MQLRVALLGVIHRRRGGRGRGIGRVRRGQVDIEVIARCTPLLHLTGLIRLRGVLIVRRVRRQCADEADDRRRRQQKRQHQPRVGRDQLAEPHRGDARHRADEDDPLHRRPREHHAQNEENRQHAEHQYFCNRIPRNFPVRRRLHPEAAAPRRGVHALTVGGVLRVLLLRRQIRFLRILLAVPLLIVRRIQLLIPLLLIPAGLHKPLLVIRLLLIRLLGVWLLIALLPIRLLITLLLVALLTVWLLITSVWLLISLLTIGLLIIRIPLLTILRLPIAVLRRVALTIGIIGRVATIRGIALRRRIIALRKTGLLRILSGVPGAIIGWTAVAHPASFPFFRAIVREVPCRALCEGHFDPPPRGLSRKRLLRALHDNASYSIAQKNGL